MQCEIVFGGKMRFLSNMFRWRYLPSVNRTWQVVSRLVFSHDSISKKAFNVRKYTWIMVESKHGYEEDCGV